MISTPTKKLRLALALLAGAAALGAGAAQAQVASYQEDPGTSLTRHLRSLSDNPRNLYALMGAAQAALKLGDPQAAVTFFARAEELAPRDPRIKAGFGSAFVQMEQPQSALKFFSDAASMGIPPGEIAGDRGLAFDLIGDSARAQADYRLALQRRLDPEIERRLALSLAIGGDQAGALTTIENQLRRQDRAAWRTRAFILALTGDAAGATRVVQSMMPAQAAAMQPFLAQLPALDSASRAMAVHFGHFPSGRRPTQVAQGTQYASLTPNTTQAGRPDAGQSAFGSRSPASDVTSPRRRPDAASEAAARTTKPTSDTTTANFRPRERRQSGVPLGAPSREERQSTATQRAADKEPEPARPAPPQVALAAPVRIAPPAATIPQPIERAPQALAPSAPSPGVSTPTAAPSSTSIPAQAGGPQLGSTASAAPVREVFGPPVSDTIAAAPAATLPPLAQSATPASTIGTVALPQSQIQTPPPAPQPEAEPATAAAEEPKPAPAPPATEKPRRPLAFAEVVEAIKALPGETEVSRPAAAASTQTASLAPPKAPPKAAEPAAEAAASRHWVQIASAPDSLVNSEYRRLKVKHPKLLSDKEGYRTPMGKSNRVLVGPFDSADDAKAFVGQLKKASLTAIAWTSPAGQEIDKIPGK